MHAIKMLAGAATTLVLLSVPVFALGMVGLGTVGTDGPVPDLAVVADEATEVVADDSLQVAMLSNWLYTGNATVRCTPGLFRKGPGHPGFDKHCSRFKPNRNRGGKSGGRGKT